MTTVYRVTKGDSWERSDIALHRTLEGAKRAAERDALPILRGYAEDGMLQDGQNLFWAAPRRQSWGTTLWTLTHPDLNDFYKIIPTELED